MLSVRALAASLLTVAGDALPATAATIYAQTGFNDQSGINANATPNSPYTIGQTVNGVSGGETGWTNAWETLDGGGLGGDGNAVVSSASPYEGDGAVAITVGGRGSTEITRDFNTRTDHFVVQTAVNFGSVGEFDGDVIEDNYPLAASVNGPQWRLIGAVGARHFEVYKGDSNGGGTWVNTGIAQTPGAWQDVVADINVPAQQWTFSVDGVSYNQTLGYQGQPPQLNAVYYFDTAAGSVDAIVVRSTPEPSLAMTAIGVAGLLSTRRRRAGR